MLRASRQRKSRGNAPLQLPPPPRNSPVVLGPRLQTPCKVGPEPGRRAQRAGRLMTGCGSGSLRSPESLGSPRPGPPSPPLPAAPRAPRLPGGPEPTAPSSGANSSGSQVASLNSLSPRQPAGGLLRRPPPPATAARAAIWRSQGLPAALPAPAAVAAAAAESSAPQPAAPARGHPGPDLGDPHLTVPGTCTWCAVGGWEERGGEFLIP